MSSISYTISRNSYTWRTSHSSSTLGWVLPNLKKKKQLILLIWWLLQIVWLFIIHHHYFYFIHLFPPLQSFERHKLFCVVHTLEQPGCPGTTWRDEVQLFQLELQASSVKACCATRLIKIGCCKHSKLSTTSIASRLTIDIVHNPVAWQTVVAFDVNGS